jgi:hypothetical protein
VLADGTVVNPRGKKLSPRKRKWYRGEGCYYCFNVKLPSEDYAHRIMVHQLAAYQKFGAAALGVGVGVRHKDGDGLNNSADNILIGTQSDNMLDRDPEDRREHAKKAARARRKLTPDEAAALREDREQGMKYAELCAKYGISKAAVSYIVNRKTYVR